MNKIFIIKNIADIISEEFAVNKFHDIASKLYEYKIMGIEQNLNNSIKPDDDTVVKLTNWLEKNAFTKELLNENKDIFFESKKKYMDRYFKEYPDQKESINKLKPIFDELFATIENSVCEKLSIGEKIIINNVKQLDNQLSDIKNTINDVSNQIYDMRNQSNDIDKNKYAQEPVQKSIDIYIYKDESSRKYIIDKEKTNIQIVIWIDIIKENGDIHIHNSECMKVKEWIDCYGTNSSVAVEAKRYFDKIETKNKLLEQMILFLLSNYNIYRSEIKSWETLLEGCVNIAFAEGIVPESTKKLDVYLPNLQYFSVYIPESDCENIINNGLDIRTQMVTSLYEIISHIQTELIMEKELLPNFLKAVVNYRNSGKPIPIQDYDFTIWYVSFG